MKFLHFSLQRFLWCLLIFQFFSQRFNLNFVLSKSSFFLWSGLVDICLIDLGIDNFLSDFFRKKVENVINSDDIVESEKLMGRDIQLFEQIANFKLVLESHLLYL